MQNKCNCGCDQGFVPVNGNWDFNMNGDCGCQQNYACQSGCDRRNRRSDCRQCGDYEYDYARENDCQCERCDDSRKVECCDQNTYVRDMGERKDDNRGRNRCNGCQKCAEGEVGYGRGRAACTGKDDCQCETCARNRSRRNTGREKDCECVDNQYYNRDRSGDCGCKKDDDNYYARNRTSCGCDRENDNASTYARSGKNRKVGMVKMEMQEIDEIFESESALRAGTLFPELHKPMNGYCPCDENCGTCKQAAAFAAWEMRLYLNTHPNDKEALAIFRKLCKEAEDENYATTFLTDECCTTSWNWVKNPWPWEYDCQCGD